MCVCKLCRSGVGAPVIGDLDGEYRYDSRRNVLEWCLPVVDVKNKTGSLEFSIAGQPNDFFPVNVSFISKGNYCNIQVQKLLESWLKLNSLTWTVKSTTAWGITIDPCVNPSTAYSGSWKFSLTDFSAGKTIWWCFSSYLCKEQCLWRVPTVHEKALFCHFINI